MWGWRVGRTPAAGEGELSSPAVRLLLCRPREVPQCRQGSPRPPDRPWAPQPGHTEDTPGGGLGERFPDRPRCCWWQSTESGENARGGGRERCEGHGLRGRGLSRRLQSQGRFANDNRIPVLTGGHMGPLGVSRTPTCGLPGSFPGDPAAGAEGTAQGSFPPPPPPPASSGAEHTTVAPKSQQARPGPGGRSQTRPPSQTCPSTRWTRVTGPAGRGRAATGA